MRYAKVEKLALLFLLYLFWGIGGGSATPPPSRSIDTLLATYHFGAAADLLQGKHNSRLTREQHELLALLREAEQAVASTLWLEVIDSLHISSLDELATHTWLSSEWGEFRLGPSNTLTSQPANTGDVQRTRAVHTTSGNRTSTPIPSPTSTLFSSLSYHSSLGYESLYTRPNEEGKRQIYYRKEIDKELLEERLLDELVDDNLSDHINPILRQDGKTLIFARKRPQDRTYHLYITQRDKDTGRFSSPTLLGMPFNSLGNDVALLFDDHLEVGALVTDRHSPNDGFDIYLFVIRTPQPQAAHATQDDKRKLAALCPWRETLLPDRDYSEYLQLLQITSK